MSNEPNTQTSSTRKTFKVGTDTFASLNEFSEANGLSIDQAIRMLLQFHRDRHTLLQVRTGAMELAHEIRELQLLSQTLELLVLSNTDLQIALRSLESSALQALLAAAQNLRAQPSNSRT